MLVNMIGGKVKENTEVVKPVLLWTNPNPTVAFDTNVLSLPTGYTGYLVEAVNTTTRTSNPIVTYIPFFEGNENEGAQSIGTYAFNGSRRYAYGRVVTSAGEGFIAFGITFEGAGAVGGGLDTWAIPTRIWGVNFTL